MNEAIEDGVGVGGIADDLMPGRHGKLRGDDRRSAPITLFEDFEQVVTGAGVERFEPEVIENEQIGAAKGFDEARMATVAARERQVFAELGEAVIDDGAIVAASLLADGASEPTFPGSARADESEIVVGVDPLTLGELLEKSAIKPARSAVIMKRRSDLAALAPRGDFNLGADPKAALLARLETIAANLERGGPGWRGDVAGVAAVARADGETEDQITSLQGT